MKRFVLSIFCATLILIASSALATDVDLSSLSYDDLLALKLKVDAEVMSRPETKSVSVPIGIYEVGVHIPAGEYSLAQDGGYASITVSKANDFSDYENIVGTTYVEEAGIGRFVLEAGQYVSIERNPILFSVFTGLGF
ncbi:MAG: hypothetical protein FWE77_01705 [Clostridia bacterium]|nr:hypothetical protein [Clostridia bacterium]